jgi:hypothetical protein
MVSVTSQPYDRPTKIAAAGRRQRVWDIRTPVATPCITH